MKAPSRRQIAMHPDRLRALDPNAIFARCPPQLPDRRQSETHVAGRRPRLSVDVRAADREEAGTEPFRIDSARARRAADTWRRNLLIRCLSSDIPTSHSHTVSTRQPNRRSSRRFLASRLTFRRNFATQ